MERILGGDDAGGPPAPPTRSAEANAFRGAPLRVVGNLPYNISTPILFRVAAHGERIRD